MQARRASQDAPSFKLFYQSNISFRRDSIRKRLTLSTYSLRRFVDVRARLMLSAPARPAAFYAPFSRVFFTALRSEIASASGSLEKSSLRNASMIVSLGIARLL